MELYPPLLCYDSLAGDLLRAEPHNITQYCSNDANLLMKSLLGELTIDFPSIPLYLRGGSGFASLDLYKVLEEKDCKYTISLKGNAKFLELVDPNLFAIGFLRPLMRYYDGHKATMICSF